MAIVALGVGFFSGVKATNPSMLKTTEIYFSENKLMDIKLMSSYGFDEEDIEAIKNTEGVNEVMAAYSADVIVDGDSSDNVVKILSLYDDTNKDSSPMNELIVKVGRLPEKSGECVIDYNKMNAPYKLGGTVTIQQNSEDGKLSLKKLKIVGFVISPQYISFTRGVSTIGNGSLSAYMYAMPEDFAYSRYTEVYITLEDTQNISCFSDEYDEIVSSYEDIFLEMGDIQCERFKEEIVAKAEEDLKQAEEEYQTAKAEAEQKLLDAKTEIENGEKEYNDKIAEAEKTLADGKAEIESAKEQLKQGEEEYNKLIEETPKQLEEAQEKINKGWEEYESGKKQLEEGIAEAQKKYNEEYEQFYSVTKPEAEEKLKQAEILIAAESVTIEYLERLVERLESSGNTNQAILEYNKNLLESTKEYYNELLAEYNSGVEQLAEGERLLKEAGETIQAEKKAGEEKLKQAENELKKAEQEFADAKIQFETGKITGKEELEKAREKIEEGEKQLVDGEKELETQRLEGAEKLQEAKEEYEKAKTDAETQLLDAEQQLTDARKEINSLSNGKWYFFTRDDNSGYSGYEEDADRIDKVVAVFPVFFLLVAALVCLTTMTRMVDEHRTEIGTLKAMGYSNGAIVKKFLVYATIAAITGSVVGILIGLFTLPYIIYNTYGMMYVLPSMILSVPWNSMIISTVVALLCTSAVVVVACYKSLKRKPSSLMRPKSPKPGKRILLERIPFIWKHFSFTSKVTARNLFRYKARFLMTVIGVAGCTALILAGFGLKDSIGVVVDRQYGEISHYNMIIVFKNSGTEEEKQNIMNRLNNDERLSNTLLARQSTVSVNTNENEEEMELYLFVPQDMELFKELVTTRDFNTKEILSLEDDTIFITERAANVYKLEVGDYITFTEDEKQYSVKIGGIIENYVYNYIYISPVLYEKITFQETQYNMAVSVANDESKKAQAEFTEEYLGRSDVLSVQYMVNIANHFSNLIKSLNIIVVVLVICAGILAFVVLYNLTNINLTERVREIATIKVLGFYNNEVASYVYRENIILTILGIIFGLIMGTGLSRFIVETIQMDMVMFGKELNLISFGYAALITAAFAIIVNLFMYFKMKKINMVESLKSIE